MKTYDVIVVGLGGMGSAAVAHLAKRGARVLGLEQFTPAHTRGSSHGQSRVIRQAYFEHPNYVPLLLRAYELWEQLQADTGTDLLTITGGLMIGPPHCQTILGSQQSARQHHLAHELLDATDVAGRFPVLTPHRDLIGLYENKAGFVRPEKCILTHLSQAVQAQAICQFEEPVVEWSVSPSANAVIVRTTKATYQAFKLVLAPGAWAPRLFQCELPLEVVRQILYWIRPTCAPAMFSPDRFPVYIWETESGLQFYGFPLHGPESDGIKVAVFYNHDPCNPDELSQDISQPLVHQMKECLSGRIPSLADGTILKSVACMYTNTPDHHFVVDTHPKYSNVVLASPCSGHGFKFCSVVGEILADLALQGKTRHGIEMFQSARFAC